jgi:hypothetical protein
MKASPLAVRIVLLCAVLVALGYSAVGFVQSDARFGHPGPLTDPTDFVAFYCGGHVLAGGHDPYLAEPLRSCEEAAFAESRIQMIPHLVVPAPFPPYALALFAAFSLVPFRAACVVFLLLAVAAIAASIALAYRFTRFHVLAIAASLIVALTVGSVYIGQIVPLVVLALCASAAALSAQRVRLACAFALCTMIEPHVGLPVLLGLAVLERRARLPVAAGVLALALLSLAAGGLALNIEYAVRVLPAHALSEVSNFGGQYSLTALLYQFGLPAGAAVRAGDLWYLGTIVAGIALARRLRDAFGDRAFAIVTPPACALVGGPFIHIHQMAVALPFAFLVMARTRPRALSYAALVVLAIPWQSIFELVLGPVFPPHVHAEFVKTLAPFADPRLLADETWKAWIGLLGARDGRTTLERFLFKLPTWFGLISLLIVAARVRRPTGAESASSRADGVCERTVLPVRRIGVSSP